MRGEEGGLAAGRDEDRGTGPRQDGGHGRAEARTGDACPDGVGVVATKRPPERFRQAPDEDRLGPPQRLEAVRMDLEQPERRIERIGGPGDPRTERCQRLEGGFHDRPVRVGIRVDEGRLRDEPMGAPERHPPPNAQRPGVRARVDDRARIPRPAAQDERSGREGQKGFGGSRPGEREGEVRPVEMEESHRAGSVRRSRGPLLHRGRRVRRGGGRRDRDRRRARHPPHRGSGGWPACPAGRSGCERPAPPSAGRRCRARAGSTTVSRARGGGRWISATAVASPPARPGGSSTTRSVSERRASAASRPSRSAIRAGLSVAASRPPGRSNTSMSVERPASSMPLMASPSSSVSGVMTTSHSSLMPRATASTGSKLRDRSSQATIEPWAWASAASLRTSVVRPLDPSPRIATLADRGRPPGPRMASSAAKPVWMTRSSWVGAGVGVGAWSGSGPGRGGAGRGRRRRQGERPVRDPRSCGSPASLEARHGCRHVRGRGSPSDG